MEELDEEEFVAVFSYIIGTSEENAPPAKVGREKGLNARRNFGRE